MRRLLVWLVAVAVPLPLSAQGPLAGPVPLAAPVIAPVAAAELRLGAERARGDLFPRPNQWKKGAIIGGSVGLVALGVFVNALCHGLRESVTEDCLGPTVGAAAVGGLTGGVIGGLIGGLFPKQARRERAFAKVASRRWFRRSPRNTRAPLSRRLRLTVAPAAL